MRLLVPAILLAAFTQPAVAAAQAQAPAAAPETTDERCLLAMLALSNSTDQKASMMGQTGVLYFAGRLKGRDANFDFKRLKPVAQTMSAETAQADLQQRCGPLVSTSLQELQTALAPPASQSAPAAKKAPPATPPTTPPKKP
jgi:hypothetical protein